MIFLTKISPQTDIELLKTALIQWTVIRFLISPGHTYLEKLKKWVKNRNSDFWIIYDFKHNSNTPDRLAQVLAAFEASNDVKIAIKVYLLVGAI